MSISMASAKRWDEVQRIIVAAVGTDPRRVVVAGHAHVAAFAVRLAEALTAAGSRAIVVADEPPAATNSDVVVWLRTPSPPDVPATRTGEQAQIVVDLHDPTWPSVRYVDPSLGLGRSWYRAETRAFFAAKADTWDERFGDDSPAYGKAVTDIGITPGSAVLDAGCGTGRALPALREAVGPTGVVIGIDITDEMLAAGRRLGRAQLAHLVLADARHLPLRDATVDAVFAAGLVSHLEAVDPTLAELARITVHGGRLALFHPTGRAALAARHRRVLRPDEPLNQGPLRQALTRTGWSLDVYDDAADRFFARATRVT